MRMKDYLFKGRLVDVDEHDYSDDSLFTMRGHIIKSSDVGELMDDEEDRQSVYFRRSKKEKRKKRKHFRSYGLMFRSPKKKREKSNISWLPKKNK